MSALNAFSAATIVVFASLGLIALALGLLARTYTTAALVTGLAGLVSLTAASTWIAQAGPVIDTGPIDDLRRQFGDKDKEISGLRDQIKQLPVVSIITAPTTTPVPPPPPPVDDGKSARLTKDLAQAIVDRDQARKDRDATEIRAARLEAELAELKVKLGSALRDKLGRLYTSTELAQPELVVGRKGSWYVLQLRPGGQPLTFGARKHELPGNVAVLLKDSARQLQDDILTPLLKVSKGRQLYVRGWADSPQVGAGSEVLTGRDLTSLPLMPNGIYDGTPQSKRIEGRLTNEHLPDLRANWLRSQIQSVLKAPGASQDPEITLLSNPPGLGHERTVDLILFVEW
jgi:hypothetical protein